MSKMENRPIAVIVTGAGAPGIQGTLYSLKQNYDNRSFHVIGTDINDFVVMSFVLFLLLKKKRNICRI